MSVTSLFTVESVFALGYNNCVWLKQLQNYLNLLLYSKISTVPTVIYPGTTHSSARAAFYGIQAVARIVV